MKTIDTSECHRYSPRIPAMEAIGKADKGERIEIIMNKDEAFNDLKEYLAEQKIGFREIYDGERMVLEFEK